MFFTFWGLTALRNALAPTPASKGYLDRAMGWMLPRGFNGLGLSRMHMWGMGTLFFFALKYLTPFRVSSLITYLLLHLRGDLLFSFFFTETTIIVLLALLFSSNKSVYDGRMFTHNDNSF